MRSTMSRNWGAIVLTLCLTAGAASAQNVRPIKWMTPVSMAKGELIEAMATSAGLSKADAGKALNAFTNSVAGALRNHLNVEVRVNRWEVSAIDDDSDGDGIPIDEVFGVFSVGNGGVTAGGCPVGGEVRFAPGNPLHTASSKADNNPLYEELSPMQENPLHGRSALREENPLSKEIGWAESSAAQARDDGSVAVLGAVKGYFATGDEVVAHRPAEGVIHRDIAARVAAVIVREGKRYALAESTEDKREVAGLLLAGIKRFDVRPGTEILRVIPFEPERCDDAEPMLGNDALIKMMVEETRLPAKIVDVALHTLLNLIADTVSNGGFVSLEGFGRFETETTITASVVDPCAGIPENCPPTDGTVVSPVTDWETSLTAVGASQGELEQMADQLSKAAKRAARTGRNPQTGKEIKIAAKKVAKFKAGKALADTVK